MNAVSARPDELVVILVSTNVSLNMGGEAIKAFQYLKFLEQNNVRYFCVTHERCVDHVKDHFDLEHFHFIQDSQKYQIAWKARILRFLIPVFFHFDATDFISRAFKASDNRVVHYIAPVSPVEPRFPPKKFKVVMGPFTGNIYYPPGLRHRVGPNNSLWATIHLMVQRIFGALFRDKRRAEKILVSGYDRTRASLMAAGAKADNLIDVVDAGVSDTVSNQARISHSGENFRFVCSGRMVDHKAMDLAIRALPSTDPRVCLDLYGDGPARTDWERIAKDLGVSGRVTFHGWLPSHDDLLEALPSYRGYLFPTLAEANGIVMQEAMMCGLPVIAMRWGGPTGLATDDQAIFIEPTSEEAAIKQIGAAMDRLATDPGYAEDLSKKGRAVAEAKFKWPDVASSWMKAYD